MKILIFCIILIAALGFFAKSVWSLTRAARRGATDPRPRFDQIPARLASVLLYFFAQKKVAEEGPSHHTSKHHLLIFWGFLVITIASAEMILNGVFPFIRLDLLPDFIFLPLAGLIDVFNLIVLTMISWAIFRRIVIRPHLIPMNLDAALILGAIASLMITHFLYHGYEAAGLMSAGKELHGWPISSAVGRWLHDASWTASDVSAAHFASQTAYWLHMGILLIFMNYLPYSKHIHLLGALPNILTRNLSERRLDMPKLDLEDENQWGVGKVEQFSWKSLLDTYACTECARCSNYCPAYTTEKNLSPMQLVHDIRYEAMDRDAIQMDIGALETEISEFTDFDPDHKPVDLIHLEDTLKAARKAADDLPALVGGRIAEDTLWACTTCGACQEVCPVFIEHPLKILQMRQSLVLEQEKVPGELARAFRNIERQSNPWGIAADQRMDWAEGLDVPLLEDNPDPEYILWVGCAGAFDNRIIKQTKAMVKVLNRAKVSYAVLGHQEECTGDPARRAGNEFLFQQLAEKNVETLNKAKAKKVIASCPHCLHTLRHDYPQFGGDYEVIHHSNLIAHLLEEEKIIPEKQVAKTVTYHDSCYLGRWNREFEAPRKVIKKLPIAGEAVEMERNRQHGFCCGAGGGRMFMEEHSPRVNDNRAKEAIDTGADTVAVACPFCNIMMTDGMKTFDKEEDVQVLDLAELVANSLSDSP